MKINLGTITFPQNYYQYKDDEFILWWEYDTVMVGYDHHNHLSHNHHYQNHNHHSHLSHDDRSFHQIEVSLCQPPQSCGHPCTKEQYYHHHIHHHCHLHHHCYCSCCHHHRHHHHCHCHHHHHCHMIIAIILIINIITFGISL